MKTLSDAIRDSLVIALLPNRSRQQHGKRAALAILGASLLALTACGSGGGGGSGSGNATPTYSIGGTITGLGHATGLVLQNNSKDDYSVPADATSFTFATKLADKAAYSVTVKTNPTGLICSTGSTAAGTLAGADVTTVAISCINTYSIGGTITGLGHATGLVLQNNGKDDYSVPADATSFTFATKLADKAAYSVTVKTHPTGLTCSPGSTAAGTLAGADVTTVAISCSVNTYSIGGTITGLGAATGLVLQNNGKDDYTVPANATSFTFATKLAYNTAYSVTVKTNPTNPTGLICSTDGTAAGTLAGADVTTVAISCGGTTITNVDKPALKSSKGSGSYTITGTHFTSGLAITLGGTACTTGTVPTAASATQITAVDCSNVTIPSTGTTIALRVGTASYDVPLVTEYKKTASTTTFIPPSDVTKVYAFVVGGGGGGGYQGAGGGGGYVRQGYITVNAATTYTITLGGGGGGGAGASSKATAGGKSAVSSAGSDLIFANGGEAPVDRGSRDLGGTGSSNGGDSFDSPSSHDGAAICSSNTGSTHGGGSATGISDTSCQDLSNTNYGGGGGGGGAKGGKAGGTTPGTYNSAVSNAGESAAANTGGGGGGDGYGPTGGNGGTGIVILYY